MRKIFILFLFLPFLGMAQPAEVVAKKIRATEKLQLSDKTLTAIVEAITVLSTHAQSPTAKAVYDLTAAMITSVSTNATLSGNGTAGDPLEIAQQSATSGQVLKWNGTTWLPANDDNTTQTLSYSAPNLSLSGGGGSVAIPQGDITGTGAATQVSYFTGTKTIASNIGLNYDPSNFRLGIGVASPNNSVHTYAAAAGTGLNGLQIDQFNSASSSLRTSRFVTQNLVGGAGRTLFYAASTSSDGEQGEFDVFSENGARFLFRIGYGQSGSVNDASFYDYAGSEKIRFSTGANSFFNGGNVGIGTTSPSYGLHYRSAAKGLKMSIFSDYNLGGETTSPNYMGIDFQGIGGYIFGSITGVDRAQNGNQGGLAFFADPNIVTPTNTLRMFIDGLNGNVGIGTGVTPTAKLDVVGNLKVSTRTGTATTIAGFGSDNICRDIALGTGLSITGGILNASGTVGGTGIANKVAYWSGTNAITATNNFAFDGTNLSVGTATPGAGRFNVTGNSTSVGLQVDAGALPDFGSTMQMRASNAAQTIYGIDAEGNTGGTSNYLNKFFNTGTGSSILQLGATSGGTGDPVVQYNITGGGNVWVGGIDNSDADKFKIQPTTSIGSTTTGVTVTTAGLVGINQDAPLVSLQVAGTDGIAVPTGTSAQRPVSALQIIRYNSQLQGLEVKNSGNWHLLNSQNLVNSTGSLTPGLALGTTPTVTINGGHESAYTLTVGTAPVANEIIYTRTFPSTWSSAPRPVFSAANALAASEITKFYVDSSTSGSYVIRANGTLTAGGLYRLNVLVHN
jgi:hypothetical protein